MTTKSQSHFRSIHSRAQYFIKRLPMSDDMIVIVLKGHLIIEEILDEILKSHCHNYQSMRDANLTFYQKAHVANSLMSAFNDIAFQSIILLNKLRNDLAHNFDSQKKDKIIELFINESKSIFGELYGENNTILGQLRNSICNAINLLSMAGDLSLIWKLGENLGSDLES